MLDPANRVPDGEEIDGPALREEMKEIRRTSNAARRSTWTHRCSRQAPERITLQRKAVYGLADPLALDAVIVDAIVAD